MDQIQRHNQELSHRHVCATILNMITTESFRYILWDGTRRDRERMPERGVLGVGAESEVGGANSEAEMNSS